MTTRDSADSHVVEPAEVFEGLDDGSALGCLASSRTSTASQRSVVILPALPPFPVGRFRITWHSRDDPATHELIAQGYEGLNLGCFDSTERLMEQVGDGIVGEVMYPSLNMLTFACEERDVVHAVFERQNHWLVKYCSEDPQRLVGVACLPLPDVEVAVSELQRSAAKGLRAFALMSTVAERARVRACSGHRVRRMTSGRRQPVSIRIPRRRPSAWASQPPMCRSNPVP